MTTDKPVARTPILCTCCEPPVKLMLPTISDMPFALCPAKRTVYELKEGKAERTELELRGEMSIVNPKTGAQVYPPEPPTTDELLARTRDQARQEQPGDKVAQGTPKTRVHTDDADYF